MRFYLTGQNNFGNRGCEALVRSTVLAVRRFWPGARFLVPSFDATRDGAQWPEHGDQGVEFVPVSPVPWSIARWGSLVERLPRLGSLAWPALARRSPDAQLIAQSDVVLSIGGDNLSLDYGVASLAYFVAVAEEAVRQGKPVAVWGASVGPFSRMPAVEQHMARHLERLTLVTVRESRSLAYLCGLGLEPNLTPVVDTAFLMTPEPFDMDRCWPGDPGDGVVGLNISWLIENARRGRGGVPDLLDEVVAFIRRVLQETRLSILLVPHVAPLDGGERNNDELLNARILAALEGPRTVGARVTSLRTGLNAAQLKHAISRCRFLIAARTHATIAAFSTGVPTISIAYSVKAEGINEDLFGDQAYVLQTPEVSSASLWQALERLRLDESKIRALYAARLPGWKSRALAGAERLHQLLRAS